MGCLLRVCIHGNRESNPQPRYVPWLGIEPRPSGVQHQCSNQLSHLARASYSTMQADLFLPCFALFCSVDNGLGGGRVVCLFLFLFYKLKIYGNHVSCMSVSAIFSNGLMIAFLKNIFYWLCYYSCPNFHLLPPSTWYSAFLPAIPLISSCPWAMHISSLATLFPILLHILGGFVHFF